MSRPRQIDPHEAKRLKQAGWTHAQIGEEYGLTASGVQQALQSIGYVKKQLSHKEALPWVLAPHHRMCSVATNLRNLSLLAQGKPVRKAEPENTWITNQVINWANEILDDGKDVDYDRDVSPSDFCKKGGFFLKDADQENYHLRKLMGRVIAAQTRKL